MAEFDFHEFERGGPPPAGDPFVTIQKRGNFGLNRAAYEALGAPERVKVLFDAKRRVIGLQAASVDDRNAYTVTKSKRSATYAFGGPAFARRHGLETSRRYLAKMHDKDGVLVVDLNEGPVHTGPLKTGPPRRDEQ